MSVTDKSLMTSGSLFISDSYCFLAEKLFLPCLQKQVLQGGCFLPSPKRGCDGHEEIPIPAALETCPGAAAGALAQGTTLHGHFRICRQETRSRSGSSQWGLTASGWEGLQKFGGMRLCVGNASPREPGRNSCRY